jgi:hypothetical protein
MQLNHRGSNPFKCVRKVGAISFFERFAIAGILALIGGNPNIRAAMLNTWQFDPTTDRLELTLDPEITPLYYIETAPPRIIIDLPGANLSPTTVEPNTEGVVRRISVLPSPTGSDRIVLELSPEIALSPQQVQLQKIIPPSGSTHWILYPSVVSDAIARPVTVNAPPPPPPPTQPTPTIEFGQPLPKSSAP